METLEVEAFVRPGLSKVLYEGRTVIIHAKFLPRGSRERLGLELQRIVPGPQRSMVLIIGAPEYSNTVFWEFKIFVNTDESIQTVSDRLRDSFQPPVSVASRIEEKGSELTQEIWKMAIEFERRAKAQQS